MLGILTSGAAYVPIDESLPKDRALYILSVTNAQCIITTAELANNIEWVDGFDCIYVDRNPVGKFHETSLQKPQNLAYIIYTSGSTGKPKGVAISHQAAVNTILDINRRFKINQKENNLSTIEKVDRESIEEITNEEKKQLLAGSPQK